MIKLVSKLLNQNLHSHMNTLYLVGLSGHHWHNKILNIYCLDQLLTQVQLIQIKGNLEIVN